MIKDIPGGVYPTMITPYTDDNKIDYNAVEQLLNWYKEKGVAGIFAICQSSEIFFLTAKERLELITFIMKHKPEGLSIVASGHVADDLDVQAEEAKAIIDTGIDAYVFISNRFAKQDESDEVLIKNMNYVISKLPEVALGVYECPHPYKRLLTEPVLKAMADNKQFRFVKDTCCSVPQLREKLRILDGSGVGLFNANSATLLQSMKDGCTGFSGIMANFYPELIVKECEIFNTDPEKTQKIQDFVGFCSAAEGQCYSCNAKYFLQLEGLDIKLNSRSADKNRFDELTKYSTEQLHGMVKTFSELIK